MPFLDAQSYGKTETYAGDIMHASLAKGNPQ